MKNDNQYKSRVAGFCLVLAVLLLTSCNSSSWQKQSVIANYLLIDSLVEADADMTKYVDPYRDSLKMEMDKVIGVAEHELLSDWPESTLTNFVSDLMLTECQYLDGVSMMPDISVVNVRGLRIPIQKGNITIGNIYQLMPFENEIVCLHMTKDNILELIDYMASVGGEGVSGITFGIKNKQAVNVLINGKPIEDKIYVVATSDYLANGGDHFDVFKSATKRENTGLKVRDAIIQHIQRLTADGKIVSSQLDKRIYHAK